MTKLEESAGVQREARLSPDASGEHSGRDALGRFRVLVARATADMRSYVSGVLRPYADVDVVATGADAIRALNTMPYDLLLADATMPLDGFDLVRRIRGLSSLRLLPVILVSAPAGGDARLEVLEAGADDYLEKPFTAEDLVARILNVVARARLHAEAVLAERHHAQETLRASEERFRALTELAPALLWETDPSGDLVSLNTRWLAYTGQSLGETQGLGWLNAIHPDDRPATRLIFSAAYATGEPVEIEHRIRRLDGTYRWFLVSQLPVRDDDGEITCWIGAASDVHARRVAFEAVERQMAERTAEVRAGDVERKELRRQLAAAEEAERRRLARELHDQLGQHLTAFTLGVADVRRRLEAGESADEWLTHLEGLSRAMMRDARHLALELRPPELDDVGLESALATYVDLWSMRYGVTAEFEVLGRDDRPVPPDAGTVVYRIAQEALTNVAKHAEARQATVLLDRRGPGIRLVVEDDGCGFAFDETTQRAKRERRLGIAGMRERAALVGGELQVEASPGKGTAIYLDIPTFDPA